MRHAATALLAATLACAPGAATSAAHDPDETATIVVRGFQLDGAVDTSVYGDDEPDALLAQLAGLVDLPSINEPGGELQPDVVAATSFYGSTPPPYYDAGDVADVAAVTAQWGGGIPRYALILAKYAGHVMERSGAAQVNFASASMGSLVVRWLIEKDVEGLAGEGRIARWLSLEGVLAGNWAVSREELGDLWETIGMPAVDLDHMRYAWVEENLHAPGHVADNELLSTILLGQTASTDDVAVEGALTAAMLLLEEFQPNDGVQGAFDALFSSVTFPSRLLGRPPTTTFHHVDHFSLEGHAPALAQAAIFLTQRRRVTITLTRAEVEDIHEPDLPFFDFTPAEIVIQSRVYSPRAAGRWGVTGSLSTRRRDGVSSPLLLFPHAGAQQFPGQVVFDDLVLEDETELEVELWAEELDWDVRYGVLEPLGESGQDLDETVVVLPVGAGGVYTFDAGDWNGDLLVEVFEYPFPLPGAPGDVDGDGTVGVTDLLALLSAWGPCPAPPAGCPADLDGDGAVGVPDLLIVLGHWE